MDGQTTVTLAQWQAWPGPAKHRLIDDPQYAPRVGVHDVRAIDQDRTWLWALSDYRVQTITGGVIWLVPKGDK